MYSKVTLLNVFLHVKCVYMMFWMNHRDFPFSCVSHMENIWASSVCLIYICLLNIVINKTSYELSDIIYLNYEYNKLG